MGACARAAVLLGLGLLAACAGGQRASAVPGAPVLPELAPAEVAVLIPAAVPGREGWAADVVDALHAHGLRADAPSVAAVLAVIAQESGFHADPAVPDLAGIVKRRLSAYEARLGPLGRPAFHALLSGRAPGSRLTFEERLARVRTEADVDRIFRDLLAFYHEAHPLTFGAVELADQVFNAGRLEDLNPITTAGSMQVSVRFAQEEAKAQHLTPDEVRDALYTRHGGVYYGVSRLLGYPTHYDAPLYRFADYNAGLYASRNAAVQHALTVLTGVPLARDGDLLAYDRNGRPQPEDSRSLRALLAFAAEYPSGGLTPAQVRADARHEKEATFEDTATYRALEAAWAAREGTPLPRGELPDVVLQSPKMKEERSTAWYAHAVERRYEAFLARAAAQR